MSFPESTIRKMDRLLQRIGAPVPPGYWDLDIGIKQREWNGIGSASGNHTDPRFGALPASVVEDA